MADPESDIHASPLDDRLAQEVAACLGRSSVELAAVVAGASNLAYLVRDPGNPDARPLAFLRSQGAGALQGTAYDLRREGALLRAAATQGFPVASVLGVFDEPVSLLMNVVPGTSRPSPEEMERAAPAYLALIARLHATEVAAFPLEPADSIREAVASDLEFWASLATAEEQEVSPLLRLTKRVLRETLPEDDRPPCVVHGDVGPGNFMVDQGRVTAMLDWELAHVGDPLEDLAWLWMRGAHSDFGDPLRRLAEYERASGRALDRERLRWHLAFVMWKSCISMDVGLRRYEATEGTLLQTVVLLTYQSLLACQLVRVLGDRYASLAEGVTAECERTIRPEVRLAERLSVLPGLSREATLIAEYLRDASAQADWERAEWVRDLREGLAVDPSGFDRLIETAPRGDLPAIARVVARAADRAALAMPKAVRRIERAKRIGLGTLDERWKESEA